MRLALLLALGACGLTQKPNLPQTLVGPRISAAVREAEPYVVIAIGVQELREGDDANISAMLITRGQSLSCAPIWETLNSEVVIIQDNVIFARQAGSSTVRATCAGIVGGVTVAVSRRP